MTTTKNSPRYYETAGYSMIDHQLDPLLEVAFRWLNPEWGDTPSPEQRQHDAAMIAETLEAAAAYIRAAGIPAKPRDIHCDECGASPHDPCWTTPEEARATVAALTDEQVTRELDHTYDVATVYDESWPDETPGPVPMDTQRADLIEWMSYEDRADVHPIRIEHAAGIYMHEVGQ